MIKRSLNVTTTFVLYYHSLSEIDIGMLSKASLIKTSYSDLRYHGVDFERFQILKNKANSIPNLS